MTNARILIVEDEGIVADEIRSRLKNLGYEVVGISSTGKEALSLARKLTPDLALMDIRIKGDMDGIQTAEQLRHELEIPVIFLTAYSDEDTLVRAKITQPFGYIIKPFEERELYTTIEISLYNHSMENKLKESEERYRIISELVSDFAFSLLVDKEGTYVVEWFTDAFTRITGYSIDELKIPEGIHTLIHKDDIPRFMRYLKLSPHERPKTIELRINTKSGDTRWLQAFGELKLDLNTKKIVRIVGAAKDITERKDAENLLRVQRDLGIDLSSLSDLSDSFDRLLDATFQVGGIDCGGLFTIDVDSGAMELVTQKGLPREFVDVKRVPCLSC